MKTCKYLVVDWSGLAHRAWSRVHKSTYNSPHGGVWPDFAHELVLDIARHRWAFDGTVVFACDGERPYLREWWWNGWYDKHTKVYSNADGSSWVVRKGTGPEHLLIEDKEDHWHKTELKAMPEGQWEEVDDPDIRGQAVEGCCPRYKERSWSWPEPKEEFERIHLATLAKAVASIPDSSWCRVPQLEADDVAATVAAALATTEDSVLLISDDSDWRQLRRLDGVDGMDTDWEMWPGELADVNAHYWAKVVGGDSSDGIPGLPKTAKTRWGKDGALALMLKQGVEESMMPGWGTPEFERNKLVVTLAEPGRGATLPEDMQQQVMDALAANFSGAEEIVIPWELFGIGDPARLAAECVARGFKADVHADGWPMEGPAF